jgi:hypothetical protein
MMGSIYMSRPVAYLETLHWTPSHICLLATQEAHREPSPSLSPAEFMTSEQAEAKQSKHVSHDNIKPNIMRLFQCQSAHFYFCLLMQSNCRYEPELEPALKLELMTI